MLAKDVRFEGFTATDWTRFLSLFRPQKAAGGERSPERPRGYAIAIHDDGRLRKLVHTKVGRLRLDDAARDWPLSAEELAKRNAASFGVCIERGSLERMMDRFGGRSRRGDDLTAQLVILWTLFQEELALGTIEVWPARLRGVPVPTASVVRSTLDMVCPVGKTLLLGLFEHDELWTSIAMHRAQDGFDIILGPESIRGETGLMAGDYRRDYRHVARAVEDATGPLALGCFAEVSTFRRLEVDATPGAWARAVAVRDVILSPIPGSLTIPLGVDATRAAVSAFRLFAERMDPFGVVAPTFDLVRQAVQNRDAKEVLGFDPLELLRRLLSREQ